MEMDESPPPEAQPSGDADLQYLHSMQVPELREIELSLGLVTLPWDF